MGVATPAGRGAWTTLGSGRDLAPTAALLPTARAASICAPMLRRLRRRHPTARCRARTAPPRS